MCISYNNVYIIKQLILKCELRHLKLKFHTLVYLLLTQCENYDYFKIFYYSIDRATQHHYCSIELILWSLWSSEQIPDQIKK